MQKEISSNEETENDWSFHYKAQNVESHAVWVYDI